ncbi:hypothetical protein GCM10023096_54610 [Nonomuraea ferruginea]
MRVREARRRVVKAIAGWGAGVGAERVPLVRGYWSEGARGGWSAGQRCYGLGRRRRGVLFALASCGPGVVAGVWGGGLC